MLRALYDKVIDLAAHPKASWLLSVVAFAESSIFPIPPDAMLIPMVLAERAKAWFFATVSTISSVLGGAAGYAIGFFLFELIGRPILGLYGYEEKFASFAAQYNDYGAWIVFFAGITPFPYKVITIASGATALNIWTFIAASVAARGLRFFIVATLLYLFGEPIRTFIEKYLGILTVVFMVCLIGGFVAVRYFF